MDGSHRKRGTLSAYSLAAAEFLDDLAGGGEGDALAGGGADHEGLHDGADHGFFGGLPLDEKIGAGAAGGVVLGDDEAFGFERAEDEGLVEVFAEELALGIIVVDLGNGDGGL